MKQIAKLSQKLPVVTGESQRGPWKKQVAIFTYPNSDTKFMVSFFGDRLVDQLAAVNEGDLVQVDFLLTCHEADTAIFPDVRGLSITRLEKVNALQAEQPTGVAMPQTDNPFEKA